MGRITQAWHGCSRELLALRPRGDFRNCLESWGSPDPFLSPTGSDEASALGVGVDVLSEFQELSITVFLSSQRPPDFGLRN